MVEERYVLKDGEKIPVEGGGYAIVKQLLGYGGQGQVYKVDYKGKELALKWYFYDKLKELI